jgi:KUP system potassium uptake protein
MQNGCISLQLLELQLYWQMESSTPPISVSSAIEGLSGIPSLEKMIVQVTILTVGIVIGIVSLLFFFQRFGTKLVRFCW